MIRFRETLNAMHTPELQSVLKRELERLDSRNLPLQEGLSLGSGVADEGFSVMVLGATETPEGVTAKVGVFYTGIVAGCSCADDPTPIGGHAEYCEIQVDIDYVTAETTMTLIPS